MVGPLKKYKKDPNGMGRGAGLYYYRGRGYYSRYYPDRDRKYSAKPKVRKIGNRTVKYRRQWKRNSIGKGRYKQTRD